MAAGPLGGLYAVFGTEVALFQANGVTLDTDPTLFYVDHGDPAKALAFGDAGLKIRPFIEMEDADAWALHVNGRDGEALAHERQAMQLGTRNALFFFHAGMIEKALGQNAAATASLKQALASNPHFSRSWGPPPQHCPARPPITGTSHRTSLTGLRFCSTSGRRAPTGISAG